MGWHTRIRRRRFLRYIPAGMLDNPNGHSHKSPPTSEEEGGQSDHGSTDNPDWSPGRKSADRIPVV